MTWISLVCLLVFTSSVLGQAGYRNGYGAPPVVPQAPPRILTAILDQSYQRPALPVVQLPTQAYGQQRFLPSQVMNSMALVRNLPTQGYGVPAVVPQFDQPVLPIAPPTLPPTQADILCQGKPAETVIPIGDGSKFVVCIDTGKGVEQDCPRGLIYHTGTRRCERRSGPVDPCALQPCLNGGQCATTDSSYRCQCPPGFDGQTCELDARVCQTQQPCGQSPDTRCQSFRLGAALQYICIFQGGFAYGLNPQQIVPSPCSNVDGAQALTVSNGGFIMCDSDRMFVESCPGGTIWDDVEKACSWPDKQTVVSVEDTSKMLVKATYGNQYNIPQQIERPKMMPLFSHNMAIQKQLNFPQQTTSYGAQWDTPKQMPFSDTQVNIPQQTTSYDAQWNTPKQTVSYGAQLDLPQPTAGYGSQFLLPQQPEQVKVIHQQHDNFVPVNAPSGY